jgi:molybdopterin synthase sulfur carrier subunit
MSATIEISSVFGRYTNDQLNTKVEGDTVGECLEDFFQRHPDMRQIVLDKKGNLRHNFDIFVNGKSSYPLEMSKPVNDGDKLNLVMLIQGG